jgi:hypothetical protein
MHWDSNAHRERSWVLQRTLVLGLALALGLVAGCGMGPFRATTTPDTMERVPKDRIRTSMWVLAAEVGELERLLEAPEDDERILAQNVRDVLKRMRTAARALETGGRSTQHPVLNEQLDRFVLQIDRAIRAVDREPPNFFRASTVAGSCFLCHGSGGMEFTDRDRAPVARATR